MEKSSEQKIAGTSQEKFLLYKKEKSIELRNEIVCENTGLVLFALQRFLGEGPYQGDTEDLQMEGTLGLISAVEHYDPDKGTAFSTFAMEYITGYMKRYVLYKAGFVKPPAALLKHYNAIRKEDPDASDAEVAQRLAISEKEVHEVRTYLSVRNPLSLAAFANKDDEETNAEEWLGKNDPAYAAFDDENIAEQVRSTFLKLAGMLPGREDRKIITIALLETGEIPTGAKWAEAHGYTAARVQAARSRFGRFCRSKVGLAHFYHALGIPADVVPSNIRGYLFDGDE